MTCSNDVETSDIDLFSFIISLLIIMTCLMSTSVTTSSSSLLTALAVSTDITISYIVNPLIHARPQTEGRPPIPAVRSHNSLVM